MIFQMVRIPRCICAGQSTSTSRTATTLLNRVPQIRITQDQGAGAVEVGCSDHGAAQVVWWSRSSRSGAAAAGTGGIVAALFFSPTAALVLLAVTVLAISVQVVYGSGVLKHARSAL